MNFAYPDGTVITGFTTLEKYLYVIIGATVDVWILEDPFNKVFTINQALLAAQGYTGTFAPKKIYGNKQQNPSLIFIDNGDSLIIADVYDVLTLLTVIPYSDPTPTSVTVAVGPRAFFLVTATNDPA